MAVGKGTGNSPFGFSFNNMWLPSWRRIAFLLERRREDSEAWDTEGRFSSRRRARRAARDLAGEWPTAEIRIRKVVRREEGT
jgi:hypothetical protein